MQWTGTTNAQADKGRWVTLILQILIGSATSFIYVMAVFYGPLSEVRGWPIEQLLFTFTLSMWIGTPSIIVAGILRDKFGNKRCIVASGIFYGLAICASAYSPNVTTFILLSAASSFFMFLVYTAQMSNIGILFPDRRGFAMGLLMGGLALGGAALPPIAQLIIDNFSVQTAIVAQGVAYGLIVTVLGLFIIDAPEGYHPIGWEPEAAPEAAIAETGADVVWTKMVATGAFWIILVFLVCLNIAPNMAISNASLMAQDAVGLDEMSGAWIVSLVNVMNGVAGLVFGPLADKLGSFKSLAIAGVIEVVFSLIAAVAAPGSVIAFAACMGALGVGYGAVVTVFPVLIMNTFGPKHFGVNFGVCGINGMICSFVAPQLTVMFPTYQAIIIGAVIAAVGVAACFVGSKIVTAYVARSKELAAVTE